MTNEQHDEETEGFFSRGDDCAERFGGSAQAERDRLIEVANDERDYEDEVAAAAERYSAMSGAKAAGYDIANGTRGAHRRASNSPAYRDAYDAYINAHKGAS